MRPRFIYFVKPAQALGPIKIGSTSDVGARLDALKKSSPVPLELVFHAAGTFETERRLHWKHIASHSHGEWFNSTPLLWSDIAKAKAGAPLSDLVSEIRHSPPLWRIDAIESKKNAGFPAFKSYRLQFSRAKRKLSKETGILWQCPSRSKPIFRRWRDSGYVRPSDEEMAFLDAALARPGVFFQNPVADELLGEAA